MTPWLSLCEGREKGGAGEPLGIEPVNVVSNALQAGDGVVNRAPVEPPWMAI